MAPHPEVMGHNHVRPPVACAARPPTRRSKPVTSPRRARQRLEAQPAHHVHQHELHRVLTQQAVASVQVSSGSFKTISLSLDGKVVVNHVPPSEKYKILL